MPVGVTAGGLDRGRGARTLRNLLQIRYGREREKGRRWPA
jgi:hypothetical protein